MNVSILSIGTELTTGQIINRNSSWIATQLKDSGVQSAVHLAAPDDRELILKSLDFCHQQSEVIFITGGLGPTTDDFTRDVISDWTKLPLEFHEESFQHMRQILEQRGVLVKENQKQQCYFPKKATVLKNSKGTANGFSVETKVYDKLVTLFVLPGPPIELEAIWNDHISAWLKRKTLHIDKIVTKTWDTLGLPESEIAILTETTLGERKKDFPLSVGYRVHLPYVEVKLSYPQSIEYTANIYVQNVEKVLQKHTVLRNQQKAAQLFVQSIEGETFAFYDFCTQGALHQSLSPYLKKHPDWLWKQSEESMDSDFFAEEENFIALWNKDEKTCQMMADLEGRKFSTTVEIPARFLSLSERKRQYFAEMAMIQFLRFFNI